MNKSQKFLSLIENLLEHHYNENYKDFTKQEIENEPDYIYHATNHYNAKDIKDSGYLLTYKPNYGTDDQTHWPDGSSEKRSYWTKNSHTARLFVPNDGRPVLLRTKNNSDFKQERGTKDIYTNKKISFKHIQYLHDDGSWKNL